MSQQTGQKLELEFPISYEQKALWFLNRLAPESAAYNVGITIGIKGKLETERLITAIGRVAYRHALPQLRFAVQSGAPVQILVERSDWAVARHDIEGASDEAIAVKLQELADRPFDLQAGPLFRADLARLTDEDWAIQLSAHHIVLDPLSLERIWGEIADTYVLGGAEEQVPETQDIKFHQHYVKEQQALLDNERGIALRAYWSQALAGELPVLNLPTDRLRPPVQTYEGASLRLAIPESDAALLRRLAADRGVKLESLLLTAYQVLLYRYSNQDELIVGVLQSGRTPELLNNVGTFVNPVLVRTNLSGRTTFDELLENVHRTYESALAHRDFPFALLVDLVEPARDPSYPPLFQVSFEYENLSGEVEAVRSSNLQALPGVRIEMLNSEIKHARYDLSLALTDNGQGIDGRLVFNVNLFYSDTIERFGNHFLQLLRSITNNPEETIARLSLLDEREKHRLVVEWNDTDKFYPDSCIHELFERQAALHPDKEAVVFGHHRLSYGELNERANQFAHYLIRLGVGPDKLVAVYLHRNLDLAVILFGILKAGGAYVPLDPNYPQDRIAVTLEEANISVIVTVSPLADELPPTDAHIIRFDTDIQKAGGLPSSNPQSGVKSNHLAYVIYTSGSTGRPKGVAIEHRSTTRWIYAAQELFEPETDFAGVLASTSICFDMSCFEFFVTLGSGGKTILAENALHLPYLPAKDEVTLINTVPSAVAELVRLNGIPPSVRVCNFGGEPLFGALLRKLFERNSFIRKAYNLYGPTEDTTFSTYEILYPGAEGDPTIGRPIPNTTVYILDSEGQPVPAGVLGELYIGGAGLAREYLNRPDQTAERFVPNPFVEERGARMYKTGDLVRYLPDRRIQYYGRIDNQVKIRGFRIELGEIESTLLTHPAVSETVVIAKGEPGHKRLIAYTEVKREDASARELREYVKSKLPDYMVPSLIIPLKQFPLNPNGKLNRLALPDPDPAAFAQTSLREEARNSLERKLVEAWKEILDVSDIGIHDNFFELGGDSLQSAQITFVLNEHGIKLATRDIFKYQTIAELAESLASSDHEGGLTPIGIK